MGLWIKPCMTGMLKPMMSDHCDERPHFNRHVYFCTFTRTYSASNLDSVMRIYINSDFKI